MNLNTLLTLCDEYAALGGAIQDQLRAVLNGESMAKQNPDALKYVRRFLISAASEDVEDSADLADVIQEFLKRAK